MESSYPMRQDPDMSMDICLANDHTTFPTQLQFPVLPNQMRVPENISPPSEQELFQLLNCEQDLCHCSYSMGSPCS